MKKDNFKRNIKYFEFNYNEEIACQTHEVQLKPHLVGKHVLKCSDEKKRHAEKEYFKLWSQEAIKTKAYQA